MFDIVSIGEVLMDFTLTDAQQGQMAFVGCAGGAPANVLAQASILGSHTAFIGMVGTDLFGKFLKKELQRLNINVDGLFITDQAMTTLTLVKKNTDGDRDFEFLRNPGADTLLRPNDDVFRIIDESRIIQYGNVAMTQNPMRTTLFTILEKYRGKKLIAYDPNLRPMIWKDQNEMKEYALKGMVYADILKLSYEEAAFLTEESDLDNAARKLQREYGLFVICITKGANGCIYYLRNEKGEKPSFNVTAQDTTGAGDAFLGALLYKLLKLKNMNELNIVLLGEYVTFANAAGAMSVTKKGTMSAMASSHEIEMLIKQ